MSKHNKLWIEVKDKRANFYRLTKKGEKHQVCYSVNQSPHQLVKTALKLATKHRCVFDADWYVMLLMWDLMDVNIPPEAWKAGRNRYLKSQFTSSRDFKIHIVTQLNKAQSPQGR